jgi:cytochrome c oxidase cbb3-type subunit 2
MPAFKEAFPDEQRWALAYYVMSLSAFADPITGAELPISAEDRAALDNPDLNSDPDQAYKLTTPAAPQSASEPTPPRAAAKVTEREKL